MFEIYKYKEVFVVDIFQVCTSLKIEHNLN